MFDHPLYFTRTGFVKSWSPALQDRVGWWSEFWWLLQCICEILCNVVAIQDMQIVLQDLKQKREQLKQAKLNDFSSQPEKRLNDRGDQMAPADPSSTQAKLSEINLEIYNHQKAYFKKCRNVMRLVFDCPTALANMKNFVGEQVGGVCGTVASFISLYEIFGS